MMGVVGWYRDWIRSRGSLRLRLWSPRVVEVAKVISEQVKAQIGCREFQFFIEETLDNGVGGIEGEGQVVRHASA